MKKLPLPLCLLVCLAAAPVATAGEKGTPDEAKALLDKAVKLVQTQGDTKALAAFNDPKGSYVDRDLYVFCFGPDNKVSAHIDKTMLGKEVTTIKDAEGKPTGSQMAEIAKAGAGSLEYKWKNPVSQQVGTKVSYLKRAGTQVCGVGAYK